MRALFYDTETTGLPLFKEPSEDPRQPHLVQIAAALVDLDTRKTIASIDLIVRPDGWIIPEEVSAIHGITTERAAELGASESMALGIFSELYQAADTRIAHNEPFDARIIRIALMRHTDAQEADAWKAECSECTQRLATPIMKLPPTAKMLAAGFNKHKSANLAEAYKHFTGLDLVDAHSALADVLACKAVYFAIKGAA